MFQIAMEAVDQTGADRLKMSIVLMLASSDYCTSFGYQTNLMVYAPGGYRNVDYLKFGGPLQVILWLSGTALVSSAAPWYVNWIICTLLFVVVAALRLTNGALSLRRKQQPDMIKGVEVASPLQNRTTSVHTSVHDEERELVKEFCA